MESLSPTLDPLADVLQPLTRERAESIVKGDPELTILLLMKLSAEVAALRAASHSPNAPSSSVPPYAKPSTPAGRAGRCMRGAKPFKAERHAWEKSQDLAFGHESQVMRLEYENA